ncbi:MAG: AbrB/MazE/SpoVT family DNA-binding domain-containing protein [Candidatus Nanohaloarchaea archaeon]
MATITSPEGEGAQADIPEGESAAFTCKEQFKDFKTCRHSSSFSATLDSKGRVTVPAEIRKRFGLEKGDRVSLELSRVLLRVEVERREALGIIRELDAEEFRYSDGTLEVVR